MEANKWMENFIQRIKVTNISTLSYNIQKMFGFSELFVKKQIKLLSRMGMVTYSEKYDSVIWIKPDIKTPQEVKEEADVEFLLKEQQHTPADKQIEKENDTTDS
tara:strand:+ start:6510 stop:6821 length:312 start_codon:yes stop_codon:yes gene_type:complete